MTSDPHHGRITVICGCMFSGKSRRLIEMSQQARAAGRRAAAFKHACDDRYAARHIATHDDRKIDAIPITRADQLPDQAVEAELILIDEAQFFGNDLVDVCTLLIQRGHDVILAGLDLDSWGLPFGPMPLLTATADEVIRTFATCARCGRPADHTQRLAPVAGQMMIGGPQEYEARCVACFVAPPAELRR